MFKVLSGFEDLTEYLNGLDTIILSAPIQVPSTTELFQLKAKFQSLKENMDQKLKTFQAVSGLGMYMFCKLLLNMLMLYQIYNNRLLFLHIHYVHKTTRK